MVVAAAGTQVVAALAGAGAGVVGSIAAVPLRTWLEGRLIRRRLAIEYEYDQRRQLREVIGRHHGRLLNAADSWSARMRNLYGNEHRGWLDVQGKWLESEYYFRTTAYRFLAVFAEARLFEAEALFVDARYAEPRDLDFVKFVRAFRWVMTDHHFVEGTGYDHNFARDHFFNDQLRRITEAFVIDGRLMNEEEFEAAMTDQGPFEAVLQFFDGLRSSEERFRWDRLVGLHLIVTAFVNAIGYELQHAEQARFVTIASHLRRSQVARNLRNALPRLGLADQREGAKIALALDEVSDRPA